MSADSAWIYIGIPFRPSAGKYDVFSYGDLPPIDCTNYCGIREFTTDLDDLIGASPTSCYFEDGSYNDQQGCVVWTTDAKGNVVTDRGIRVADSVAEFVARIKMENEIWFAASYNLPPPIGEAYRSMNSFFDDDNGGRVKDPAKLFRQFGEVLAPEQMAYIKSYYEKYTSPRI